MQKDITKDDVEFYLEMINFNTYRARGRYYQILSDQNSDDYKRFIKVYQTFRDQLNLREQQIVDLVYGVNGNPKTLKEIGLMFNLTPERIRQIKAKSHRKMRYLVKEYLRKNK